MAFGSRTILNTASGLLPFDIPADTNGVGATQLKRALSDPIRRNILSRLAHGECSVTTLAEPFDVSAPAITKHLRVLESAGLIERRKEGRVNYCCLNEDPLREADDWIRQQQTFWEQQLDLLEKYLEKENSAWANQSKEPELPSDSRGVLKRRVKRVGMNRA